MTSRIYRDRMLVSTLMFVWKEEKYSDDTDKYV